MAVEAINRTRGIVLMASGSIVPVTNWLDDDGDETDDAMAAAFAIVQGPDGKWHALDLSDYCEVQN